MRARFIPKNPHKYMGDVNKIFARSSWEVHVMKFFDSSSTVLKWGSEEFSIPYIKPTDGQVHQYFPDFIVVYQDRHGAIKKEIIEVKPLKESSADQAKNAHDRVALAVNIAKWRAADEFAQRNGMVFRVLTEQSIFKQVPRPAKPRRPRTKKAKT